MTLPQNLPRQFRLPKFTGEVWNALIRNATEGALLTPEELQGRTSQVSESVHMTTFNQAFNISGIYGKVVRRKALLKKKENLFSVYRKPSGKLTKHVENSALVRWDHVGNTENMWKMFYSD